MQLQQRKNLLKKAADCYNSGQHQKSEKIIARLLKSNPDNAEASFLKGMNAYARGRTGQAISRIEQAISVNPDIARYHFHLAFINVNLMRLPEAERELDRCLELEPAHQEAKGLRADIFRIQGRHAEAYTLYRELHQAGLLGSHGYYNLMQSLTHLSVSGRLSEVEQDLISFLAISSIEHNKYSTFISYFLRQKYGLDNPEHIIDMDNLVADRFLTQALEKIYFKDPVIEVFLTGVRRELLLECLETSSLARDRFDLAISMAHQCFNNEYVFYISAEEEEMSGGLQDLLGVLLQGVKTGPDDLVCLLAVLAMYLPLTSCGHAAALLRFPADSWEGRVGELVRRCLYEPAGEIEQASKIRSINTIQDETSKAVQAQYEENPYPRWINMSYMTGSSLAAVLQFQLPGFSPPAYLNNKKLRVLVAGCGTGRQPLEVAKSFRNTSILAVDLSRRSLAYAGKMAKYYRVSNIEFMQADILELGNLNEKFHLIYCGGVLHHMREPMAGWRVLRGLLLPGGLMKIGLYSELARRYIVRIRNGIGERGIAPECPNIRLFRQGILRGQLGGEIAREILKIGDFYSMSSCRDLLFHVQEHRYDSRMIQRSLADLQLEFLGFVFKEEEAKRHYRQLFPEDRNLTDLDNWGRYEQQNPDLFTNMYQFWCQANS